MITTVCIYSVSMKRSSNGIPLVIFITSSFFKKLRKGAVRILALGLEEKENKLTHAFFLKQLMKNEYLDTFVTFSSIHYPNV